jgi:hypothetical protein
MRILIVLLSLILLILSGCGEQENKLVSTKANGPDEIFISSGKELAIKPQLSKEQKQRFSEIRKKLLSTKGGCPGAFPAPLAVSVFGSNHYSSGDDFLLTYPIPKTNEGNAWMDNSTFFAPCPSGLYHFDISFVKDSFYPYPGPPEVPTTDDDVYMVLTKNEDREVIGLAWSGEGEKRGTGAYSVTLRLEIGEYIQTWVRSDGGAMRRLLHYNFSVYRISN